MSATEMWESRQVFGEMVAGVQRCSEVAARSQVYVAHGQMTARQAHRVQWEDQVRRYILKQMARHGLAWRPERDDLRAWADYMVAHAVLEVRRLPQEAFLAEAARLRQERDRRLVGMRRAG